MSGGRCRVCRNIYIMRTSPIAMGPIAMAYCCIYIFIVLNMCTHVGPCKC